MQMVSSIRCWALGVWCWGFADSSNLFRTFWAKAFYHKIGRTDNVAVWQFNFGYMFLVQADSLSTTLAEKMQVRVFVVFVVVAFADFVTCATVATLDNVHQMILAEKIECPQDS